MAQCAQLAQFDEELYKVGFIVIFRGQSNECNELLCTLKDVWRDIKIVQLRI